MKDYIESRLPTILWDIKECPHCKSKDFNIERSTFLYFSFDKDGNIINIDESYDDFNITERIKCSECGITITD